MVGPGSDERWLVISYWANVEGMAPSFHIDDRLPHLQQAGLDLEVITSICGPRPPGWGHRWHRVPSLSPSGLRFELRHVARGVPRPWGAVIKLVLLPFILPLYAVENCFARLESTFWWWLSAGLCGLWWTRRNIDLVYSSGGAVSAHLAAALIACVRRRPWIAEIRDPLPYLGRGRPAPFNRIPIWIERFVHARATGVVYLTRTACVRAQARTRGRGPCTTIYAGAEPRLVQSPRPGQKRMCVVHVGSLAGTRTPETLLAAMTALVARGSGVRETLRLRLVGSLDARSRRVVARFPYPEMVELAGKVSRRVALEIMQEANVALLIQNRDAVSQETIPSKAYEYLLAGTPVLGLTYRNLELTDLLRQAGHRAVEVDDPEAIASELEGLLTRWQRRELTAQPCLRYTRPRAAAELIAWSRWLRGPREVNASCTRTDRSSEQPARS